MLTLCFHPLELVILFRLISYYFSAEAYNLDADVQFAKQSARLTINGAENRNRTETSPSLRGKPSNALVSFFVPKPAGGSKLMKNVFFRRGTTMITAAEYSPYRERVTTAC